MGLDKTCMATHVSWLEVELNDWRVIPGGISAASGLMSKSSFIKKAGFDFPNLTYGIAPDSKKLLLSRVSGQMV